jgi:hypothetical protein
MAEIASRPRGVAHAFPDRLAVNRNLERAAGAGTSVTAPRSDPKVDSNSCAIQVSAAASGTACY